MTAHDRVPQPVAWRCTSCGWVSANRGHAEKHCWQADRHGRYEPVYADDPDAPEVTA